MSIHAFPELLATSEKEYPSGTRYCLKRVKLPQMIWIAIENDKYYI